MAVSIPDRSKPPRADWPPEVTDRHMQLAYSHRVQEHYAAAGERVNEPDWQAKIRRLSDERETDPMTLQLAELIAAHETATYQLNVMFSLVMGDQDDPTPPAWIEFTEAKRFMDEGWRGGNTERPSVVFELNRLMIDNRWTHNPEVSERAARVQREDYERRMLAVARFRYHEGFCANPYGPPVRRSADG